MNESLIHLRVPAATKGRWVRANMPARASRRQAIERKAEAAQHAAWARTLAGIE